MDPELRLWWIEITRRILNIFSPFWIKDVLPEFFVIFKVPQPLSYPYPTNVTTIVRGTQV